MSGKNKNIIKMELLSLAENVALARVVIASLVAHVDGTLNDLEEIKVAVSEAVSNAIIHGYQNKTDEMVLLEIYLDDNNLEIIIEDKGIGIDDIEQAMTPAYSTDPERMGLGFVFMKSFMDQVEVISKKNEGTKVILKKKLDNLGTCSQIAN